MIDFEKYHSNICDELNDMYCKKNRDYGNSVHETYLKYGMTSFLVRMEDKLNRIKTLTEGDKQYVEDEKVQDSLKDLANYAILALMEYETEAKKGGIANATTDC